MSSWQASAKALHPPTYEPTKTKYLRSSRGASREYETTKPSNWDWTFTPTRIVVVRILDHSAPQPAQKFTPAKFLEWVKTQIAAGRAGA